MLGTVQARQEHCEWIGEESSCERICAIAILQITLSLIDYIVALYLLFNDAKLVIESATSRYGTVILVMACLKIALTAWCLSSECLYMRYWSDACNRQAGEVLR